MRPPPCALRAALVCVAAVSLARVVPLSPVPLSPVPLSPFPSRARARPRNLPIHPSAAPPPAPPPTPPPAPPVTRVVTALRAPAAVVALTLRLRPPAAERVVSVFHHAAPPAPLRASVSFAPPVPVPRAPFVDIPARLTLSGAVGEARLAVTARTNNTALLYVARLHVVAAGVSVLLPAAADAADAAVAAAAAAAPPRVPLGSFRRWLHVPQVAVPVVVQRPSPRMPPPHPRHFALHLRPRRPGAPDFLLDSVRYDPACLPSATLPDTAARLPPNTLFMHAADRLEHGVVTMRPACGIALTPDLRWLVVRLEAYRVSDFGFAVLLEWRNPAHALGDHPTHVYDPLFPMPASVEFAFDPAFVPPPILRAVNLTLDPLGGELLRLPLENVLTPPRQRPLRPEHLVLRLQGTTGTTQVSSTLTATALTQAPSRRTSTLSLRTPRLPWDAEQLLIPLLLYAQSGGPAAVRAPAVVAPGEHVVLRLASAKQANLDSCLQNDTVYRRQEFVVVQFAMRSYNASSLTDFKNRQFAHAIRAVFPWLPEDGLRLVHFSETAVAYAVLLVNTLNDDHLAAQTRELDASMSNGMFAASVNLWQHDLVSQGVRLMRQSVCEAFPHLLDAETAAAADIQGKTFRLIPLWVSLAVALMVVLTATTTGFLAFVKPGQYGTDRVTDSEGDSESAASHRPRKPRIYALETHEELAKRYDVESTLSLEHAPESDLASTVMEKNDNMMGALINAAVEIGKGIGKGVAENWVRLTGRESRTPSGETATTSMGDGLSPRLYVESRTSSGETATTSIVDCLSPRLYVESRTSSGETATTSMGDGFSRRLRVEEYMRIPEHTHEHPDLN